MSTKLQPIKGMKDIMPSEHRSYTHIIDRSRHISQLYGYGELSTPLLELINVFDRSLGESSDVVSKEMYDFIDKGNRHVALRPEFTASIMRAVISNNLIDSLPQKFFSHGPVFRYDRPQAGRQRQFYQLNFENIGSSGAYHDAEIIELAAKLLEDFGILGYTKLEINSLSNSADRASYNNALIEYFSKYKNDLSEDSKKRLDSNPLRIMDSKDDKDKKLSVDAPKIDRFYCSESRKYFDKVLEFLSLLGVQYEVNLRLARGLDYYCHTSFEFVTDRLGSQSAVLAGGRYDGLYNILSESKTTSVPAIGFAAGVERILLLSDHAFDEPSSVCILPFDERDLEYSARLVSIIRSAGIIAYLDSDSKIQKRLKRASSRNAKFVIFIGEEERKAEQYQIKDLESGQQQSLSLMDLMKFLKSSMLAN